MTRIHYVVKTLILLSCAALVANILWVFKLQTRIKTDLPPHSLVKGHDELIVQGLNNETSSDLLLGKKKLEPKPNEIIIAAVACGDRAKETLIMMKSALVLSQKEMIRFIIFADDLVSSIIREEIKLWPMQILFRVNLDLHPIQLPEHGKVNEWKKLFKPCASQRLFFPSLLKNVDSLLYMDTDTIFLTSPFNIWKHFNEMNSSQMAALAPEHEDSATGWYNRFARHPYYGNLGVNSGVMLMNLTRMRQFGWEKYVIPIYHEYKSRITWGDQDIINIVFHFHPEKLYIYPCNCNFRPDHCMYMSVCNSAEEFGVFVIHGNRGSFHNEKQPAFQCVFNTFAEYQFGDDLKTNLVIPMNQKLEQTVGTNCGKIGHILTKALEELVNNWHENSQV